MHEINFHYNSKPIIIYFEKNNYTILKHISLYLIIRICFGNKEWLWPWISEIKPVYSIIDIKYYIALHWLQKNTPRQEAPIIPIITKRKIPKWVNTRTRIVLRRKCKPLSFVATKLQHLPKGGYSSLNHREGLPREDNSWSITIKK